MRESAYKKAILKSQHKKDTVLHEIALHLGLFAKIQKTEEEEKAANALPSSWGYKK